MVNGNQNVSILFRLNKQRSKNGKPAIYLRLTVNNKRVELSTYQYIDSSFWDYDGQLVKAKSEDADTINSRLTVIKAKIYKHYGLLLATEKNITAEILRNAYLGISAEQKTLQEAVTFYIDRFREKVKAGKKANNTLKSLLTTQHKISAFLKNKFHVSDIPLKEIKSSFAPNLEHYLATVQRLSNNSIVKNIKILKRILKSAVEQEWIERNPLDTFRCTYEETNRERLTMEEIMDLYKKDFYFSRLEEVRDIFLFCCFTGFAYQDVLILTPDNLVTGIDGEKWVMKTREKTNNPERVPLMPIALEIVEKYKHHPYCIENNVLLPVNSNQRYNGYLKEIAVMSGINKNLTTHMARHTFATTVTLEHDVPIETVSQMLGHKSIRTTQIYAKVTQLKVSNNMQELKNKLFGGETKMKQALRGQVNIDFS